MTLEKKAVIFTAKFTETDERKKSFMQGIVTTTVPFTVLAKHASGERIALHRIFLLSLDLLLLLLLLIIVGIISGLILG